MEGVRRACKDHFFKTASLAHYKNRSAAVVTPFLAQATPTTKGAGAGEKGMSFKRGPAVQARDCGAMATPFPASTAVMRPLTLSCSSAMRGLLLLAANMAVKNSWASG